MRVPSKLQTFRFSLTRMTRPLLSPLSRRLNKPAFITSIKPLGLLSLISLARSISSPAPNKPPCPFTWPALRILAMGKTLALLSARKPGKPLAAHMAPHNLLSRPPLGLLGVPQGQ
jgi:hypothetical protein